MKVSVVTVCRNDLEGLSRTRASVVAQDYAWLEHVIVDGASTDGTTTWLASLDISGVETKIISESDRGIYDAMNKGIKIATGSYAVFMNSSDTFSRSDSLTALVSALRTSEDKRWAIGITRIVSEHQGVTRPVRLHGQMQFRKKLFRIGWKTLPHQAAIAELATIRDLGGFKLDDGIAADQAMFADLLALSEPAVVLDIVADCLDGGVGSSQSSDAFAWQMRRIRQKRKMTVLPGGRIMDDLATLVIALVQRTSSKLNRCPPGKGTDQRATGEG